MAYKHPSTHAEWQDWYAERARSAAGSADIPNSIAERDLGAHLDSYASGVASGAFDQDLTEDERADVHQWIYRAARTKHDFGGMTREQLVTMYAVPSMVGSVVAERVAEIIRNV